MFTPIVRFTVFNYVMYWPIAVISKDSGYRLGTKMAE